ncbi:unnamed protein product [Tilletia controversa]|uniref:Uncharacterized protein n=3 Tax=Tilletia TaxID=13289 RepID=A0A8X7SX10_9BASI|nr:hypothetical protein CF336_g4039 [Tilletia laevis]KAE8197040.1 hypothetical protein CF328_g3967 [Tilletia controversa]KAE8260898.1 hypothetical protein A4X03_0g3668 [Tilletia caries]KAE8202263.1 hypothetical protein CF335_g3486 [Tilletia laevis]KAE8247130.1 hypothetical protein A4X06_0g4680 [Tilletia controversa]
MATGEKATLRLPAPFQHARLDLYPYFPAVVATSGLSLTEIDRPLPFLLYLHDGILPFHTGSCIDAPPQIVSWCQSRGVPLLSLDYTLLSNPPSSSGKSSSTYTLEDVWACVEACWRFINNASVLPDSREVEVEETLSWQITATGHGAEADKGTRPLDDAWREFQPRGIDGRAGMIWGTGAGGYLASLAAAKLHPAPIAVVLERPLLDLTGPVPEMPSLPRVVREPPPFPYTDRPSFAGISDRIWFESMEANEEEYWRKNSGMDVRRPLPGERDGAQILRMAIEAFEQRRKQGSSIVTAFSSGKIPSTSAAAVSSSSNSPLPPTLVLTNLSEQAQHQAKHFLDAVRATSPEGAVADKLLLAGAADVNAVGSAPNKATGLTGAQRYVHLHVDDKTEAIPLLGGGAHMTQLPPSIFSFLSQHLADALFLRASREGTDGSGVVEELRRQAHMLLSGQAKL